MTNQIHNLDEETKDLKEYFEFILDGNTYQMRYPTTEEVEAIQKIKDLNEQGLEIYKLIKPVTDGAPEILDALKKKSIKVLEVFSKMIRSEMGLG